MFVDSLLNPVETQTQHGVFQWGNGKTWTLFAGPDIYESHEITLRTASTLKKLTSDLGIPWIFKCSYDKANRSSARAYRGPGMKEGLKALALIKQEVGCALITDVHECAQVEHVAEVADVIQIPAFLCRQTDLIQEVARTGKVLNIKKGQFMAPWDMKSAIEKAKEAGSNKVLLCERGSSFGYNRLVNDMTGIAEMRSLGCPVIMDATHSVQLPGGLGSSSGGRPEMIAVLARAAMAVGVDGIFLETHPDPSKALCDGPSSIPLNDMKHLLEQLQAISKL